MITDNVQVCATLRNFESDSEYLNFEDFWIQKLTEEDRKLFCKELNYFTNCPIDNYIAVKWYYIGRGKGSTVLRDNSSMFFFPLFRMLKLFKKGDLITPFGFYKYNNKWHEMEFHGENYGYGWEKNSYFFKKEDIEAFNIFRKELTGYLEYIDFPIMPYLKMPKLFDSIDTRCFLAIHMLLKGSAENYNPFLIIDRLIDCTIALESLYLLRGDDKRDKLSSRIAALLSEDKSEEKQIRHDIKKFYDIRSDIVHGSLIDRKKIKFLDANIYNYEDILRKSILAFLDLNSKNPSKKGVLKTLDEAMLDSDLKKEIQESLKILKLAR
jgi:hypothetical protein